MSVQRFAIALAIGVLVLVALPRPVEAQTASPVAYAAKVFAAIDAVTLEANYLAVTGLVQGEATPSTWRVALSPELTAACQRSALLAMSRPGQYLLEIQQAGSATTLTICRLTRVTP